MLRTALDRLYLWSGYAAGIFLVLIFALLLGMSAGRKLGVNIPAGDDIASWCMASCAFLGLAHTFKCGEMIRVGLLIDGLPERARFVVEIVSLVLGLGFIGFFTWNAIRLTYDSWRLHDVAQGVLPVPLWIPQLGYTAGLVILTVAFLDELLRVLGGHRPSYEKEPPKSAEEVIERAISTGV
jgi:TRAP-type C4-dicarboxylate transport system permease small subunit